MKEPTGVEKEEWKGCAGLKESRMLRNIEIPCLIDSQVTRTQIAHLLSRRNLQGGHPAITER